MPDIVTDENLKQYVNTDHTIKYIKEIYKNCLDVDPALMIELRKLGNYRLHDGTHHPARQSTAAQILQFNQDDWQADLAQWFAKKVLDTAPLGIGAFMCPGLLKDRKATDKSVRYLVSVCVDFDTGNPTENRTGFEPVLPP